MPVKIESCPMLQKGQFAPDFILDDQGRRLYDLKKKAVLFFYPGDFTSVCTKEACYFRDHGAEFAKAGAEIYGISKDDSASHEKFKNSYQLNYRLISDPEQNIAKLYHVVRSIPFLPPRRLTFVLNEDARIMEVIHSDLDYRQHVERAIEVLKG